MTTNTSLSLRERDRVRVVSQHLIIKLHGPCRLFLHSKRQVLLVQFDHEMFKGFPVSIPMTVFMAEIKIAPQLFLIIIMKGIWNRFFIQQETIFSK